MNYKQPSDAEDSLPLETSANKSMIVNLLQQISDHHDFVTVALPEINTKFTSAILEVDSSDEHFMLDELVPNTGQSHIENVEYINIVGHAHGITASFNSRLIRVDNISGELKRNVLMLPTTINYNQKRYHYRVPVGYNKQCRVTLTMNKHQSYTGELRDLSLGGIRAIFPYGVSINVGDIAASCLIDLENQKPIKCPLKIRFSHPSKNNKALIVGGSFLQNSLQQERSIQRLVRALEREQLKKRF